MSAITPEQDAAATPTEPWRALYPFATRRHKLPDGNQMSYVDEWPRSATVTGNCPIVCVHGNPSWSFLYRDLIPRLSLHCRVIAPDHLGCGLSDKPGDRGPRDPKSPYHLSRRVDDLEHLINALIPRDQPVTLVLHDWGGMIGLSWARRNPGRLRRLVLLNTSGFLLPKSKPLPLTLRLIHDVPGFGAIAVRGFNAFASLAANGWATERTLSPEAKAGFLAPYDSYANRIATLRFVQDIPLSPRDRSWPEAQATDDAIAQGMLKGVPTLLAWGLRDFVFDEKFLAEWKRRAPQAKAIEFPDAGHYVLDDAGEPALAAIAAFLGGGRPGA